MTNPLISIIVPVYNTEKYLCNCLDSIITQSYNNWEAICINDGSTDDSLNILKKYAEKDKRIKIINQPNRGLSETRNVGIKKVKGDYIMFLDSDDFWHPETLDILINVINQNDYDILSFSFKKVQNKKYNEVKLKSDIKQIKYKIYTEPLVNFIKRKIKITSVVWNKIYKASLIKDIEFIKINPGEDNIFVFECLAKSKNIAIIKNELYFYNQNPTSIMHTSDEQKIQKAKIVVADNIRKLIKSIKMNKRTYDLCNRYLNDKIMFRDRIIYMLKNNYPENELKNEIVKLKNLKAEGKFDDKGLTLKNKIIWLLLQNEKYKICKIIA